jgi:D-aminoacyl-tRNA deacylase
MRGLVQRVSRAAVRSEGELVGQIERGLCVLVGVTHTDTAAEAKKLASKLVTLRIFDDEGGVMNKSVQDIGGAMLIVSQFTLYGDTSGGRRPSWINAARPEHAEPLVDEVVQSVRQLGIAVETGRFRTTMEVELTNDGPVTVMIEV